MPDSKITALTSISTSTDPANDPLVIVDVSDTSMAATGTTKKVTLNQLLGASGTATLASATISGNLTVDTNTLFVDAANNRVGIGTATPSVPLEIRASDNSVLTTGGSANFTQFKAQIDSGAGAAIGAYQNLFGYVGTSSNHYLEIRANNIAQQKIEPLGIFSWFDGAGGTRMTLNSTGLGVGVSPSARFHSKAGAVTQGGIIETSGANALLSFADAGTSSYTRVQIGSSGNNLAAFINSVQSMTLDASGNLGIGVTSPAAKLHVEGSGPQARFSVATAVDARHEYYRNGIREGLLYWDANLIGLYATQSSGELVLASANTIRVRINSAGDTISNVTATPPTLSTNRQMVFNLTSDTNLRISVRGTDGTTRTANITLA